MIYAEAHKGTTLFVTTHYMDEGVLWPGFYNGGGSYWGPWHPKNLKQQYQVDSMNDVFLKLARNEEPQP
jgi:ABC-2 type transport system ATP-binding protein